jgi:hypothetical protein
VVLVEAAGGDQQHGRAEVLQRQLGRVLDPLDQLALRHRVEPFVRRVVVEQYLVAVHLEVAHHVVEFGLPLLAGHELAPLATGSPAVLGDPARRHDHDVGLTAERLHPRDRAGAADGLVIRVRRDDEQALLT